MSPKTQSVSTKEVLPFMKAEVLDRVLARSVDLLIAVALSKILPPVGPLAAILYILIADGIYHNQSLGKRVLRLQVVHLPAGASPAQRTAFKSSCIRNLPFALLILLMNISILGWILFFVLGIPLVVLELYFVLTDDKGMRLGDFFAETMVVHLDSSGVE